jgi:DNA adenine methylase
MVKIILKKLNRFMKYMGSKARFAKEILPITLQGRKPRQYYVEPFVGGCNIMDKVKGNRIGADSNKYLIALWKGLQDGRELIMEISKELYSEARTEYNNRTNIKFDDFELGWIGFMGGFNGRFYGGGYSGTHGNRNYVAEQIRNTLKQKELIKAVEFYNCNYSELQIPNESIIYCDIPYQGTKEYDTKDKFNHTLFWDWCRKKSAEGHEIYVSEYNAPDDFECIWEKKVNVSIRQNKTLQQTEKLFVLKSEGKKEKKKI